MRERSEERLNNVSWYPFSDEPILEGKWYMPRLGRPSFLFPEESPDGKWHLFVDSWWGLHHYISHSGIAWKHLKIVQFFSRSPSVIADKGSYYLLYERKKGLLPSWRRSTKRTLEGNPNESRIEMRSSNDLLVWSQPRLLLSASAVDFSSVELKSGRLTQPKLVATPSGYRLYFGASQVRLDDSREFVTRSIGSAFATEINGPYKIECERPLVQSVPNERYRNLAAGGFTVLRGVHSYYALQTAAYWDEERHSSLSALLLLNSEDGLRWELAEKALVLSPPHEGWASQYITACDVRYKSDERCYYCYFSATADSTSLLKREAIGLLIGKFPALRAEGEH